MRKSLAVKSSPVASRRNCQRPDSAYFSLIAQRPAFRVGITHRHAVALPPDSGHLIRDVAQARYFGRCDGIDDYFDPLRTRFSHDKKIKEQGPRLNGGHACRRDFYLLPY